jgi:benzoyl-CoA reductase/2-hydroxyglutaryl-CoA dehydratase subunit BcrC/BadD/HgdB
MSKVKMRRDFENMTNELIEVYNKLPRRNRRQIDPIIAKIVWGNKKANQIAETLKESIVSDYNAAVAQLDEVQEAIKESNENTVMAATASGDGE